MQDIALYLTVLVPQNLLHFCCRYTGKSGNEPKYNLKETDPERLASIIQTVKTANPNQFVIEDRPVNRACLDAISTWNDEHPEEKINVIDIIKSINIENYKQSKIGTSGKHTGEEMHEFAKIKIGNFAYNARTSMYIKFVTPEDGKDIQIISFHRPTDI